MSNEEYIAPGVKMIENSYDRCEQLIDIVNNMDMWRTARVGDNEERPEYRTTRNITLSRNYNFPTEFFRVSHIIYNHALKYADEMGANFFAMEEVQMLHYTANQGFYKPHTDAGPQFPREFSALLYLNDVEEGGETEFVRFGLSVKPVAGNLLLFPANYPYLHQAHVPVSNDKYALVTWFKTRIEELL